MIWHAGLVEQFNGFRPRTLLLALTTTQVAEGNPAWLIPFLD